MIPATEVSEVVKGIAERNVLGDVDALLVGYQGSAEVGQVILETAELVKKWNPEAVFCADPVMGDTHRGFYARPGIPEFMRDRVVPAADIMTPNLFELQYLTGRDTQTVADVLTAARELQQRGPGLVLVTSVVTDEAAPGVMRMVAVDHETAWSVETPRLERDFTGSGDLTTALFLANWLETSSLEASLSATASSVYSILEFTWRENRPELALVAAQEAIRGPEHHFQAARID